MMNEVFRRNVAKIRTSDHLSLRKRYVGDGHVVCSWTSHVNHSTTTSDNDGTIFDGEGGGLGTITRGILIWDLDN